jgi:hypothetical protein
MTNGTIDNDFALLTNTQTDQGLGAGFTERFCSLPNFTYASYVYTCCFGSYFIDSN